MSLALFNRKRNVAGALAPNGELTRFREEMDRAIDRFFNDPFHLAGSPERGSGVAWTPAVDVSEAENEFVIRAELPGVAAKDVEISVAGDTLTIAGEKSECVEKAGENFYRCERSFGSFRRMIELPSTADAEKVTAESDNGVVTIHVAKKIGARAKQIEVKSTSKKS